MAFKFSFIVETARAVAVGSSDVLGDQVNHLTHYGVNSTNIRIVSTFKPSSCIAFLALVGLQHLLEFRQVGYLCHDSRRIVVFSIAEGSAFDPELSEQLMSASWFLLPSVRPDHSIFNFVEYEYCRHC